MRILVIEDEQAVVSFIKEGLEEQSFEVDVAYDGHIGERLALSRDYNVILLDIVIPGINGFDLCKIIKTQKPQTPVMMLTTLATTSDKVTGFEAGADDYLVKPFEFAELMARVKALSRRKAQAVDTPGNFLYYEDLQLDTANKVVIRNGKIIMLTAKEYSLLEYFIQNKGRVISRAELAEKIWDIKFDTGTNVVEVYINILRNKIDREFDRKLIHTRVGFGYFLK
jgi:two-component system, OmpR family, copper resistance phosphate regulon response regulator CusR